jgi:hypothetical protein
MRREIRRLERERELQLEGSMAKIVALLIGLSVAAGAGCGSGTLGGGPDGAAPSNNGCAALGACACAAASDRCIARTEACYCPTECAPEIVCICGGGRFLACEDKAPTTAMACTTELARVQQACAMQPFVNYISDLCSTRAPSCVASCLQNLGSCSEIDCSFCPVCDCAGPTTPSPLSACLGSCAGLR